MSLKGLPQNPGWPQKPETRFYTTNSKCLDSMSTPLLFQDYVPNPKSDNEILEEGSHNLTSSKFAPHTIHGPPYLAKRTRITNPAGQFEKLSFQLDLGSPVMDIANHGWSTDILETPTKARRAQTKSKPVMKLETLARLSKPHRPFSILFKRASLVSDQSRASANRRSGNTLKKNSFESQPRSLRDTTVTSGIIPPTREASVSENKSVPALSATMDSSNKQESMMAHPSLVEDDEHNISSTLPDPAPETTGQPILPLIFGSQYQYCSTNWVEGDRNFSLRTVEEPVEIPASNLQEQTRSMQTHPRHPGLYTYSADERMSHDEPELMSEPPTENPIYLTSLMKDWKDDIRRLEQDKGDLMSYCVDFSEKLGKTRALFETERSALGEAQARNVELARECAKKTESLNMVLKRNDETIQGLHDNYSRVRNERNDARDKVGRIRKQRNDARDQVSRVLKERDDALAEANNAKAQLKAFQNEAPPIYKELEVVGALVQGGGADTKKAEKQGTEAASAEIDSTSASLDSILDAATRAAQQQVSEAILADVELEEARAEIHRIHHLLVEAREAAFPDRQQQTADTKYDEGEIKIGHDQVSQLRALRPLLRQARAEAERVSALLVEVRSDSDKFEDSAATFKAAYTWCYGLFDECYNEKEKYMDRLEQNRIEINALRSMPPEGTMNDIRKKFDSELRLKDTVILQSKRELKELVDLIKMNDNTIIDLRWETGNEIKQQKEKIAQLERESETRRQNLEQLLHKSMSLIKRETDKNAKLEAEYEKEIKANKDKIAQLVDEYEKEVARLGQAFE